MKAKEYDAVVEACFTETVKQMDPVREYDKERIFSLTFSIMFGMMCLETILEQEMKKEQRKKYADIKAAWEICSKMGYNKLEELYESRGDK